MSNPNMASVPVPDDDGGEDATMEVDGDAVLDPDIDDGLVDSASADRMASGDDSETSLSEPAVADEPDVLAADVPAGGAGADSGSVDAVQIDPEDEATIPDRSPMNDEPGVGTRRQGQ
ncbi:MULTISPECIES: hypothetical protein [Microbacterium]|uniref:Sugar ABC transporter ATPase n=1 Tax=Microbacterium profundi TaxID=450380 RepID=A0ABV3LGB6_9MICO|nr:hypothetical protein [Microbacterium profundi]MCE7482989.1 hypothetical protein [Microbacterium profundi]